MSTSTGTFMRDMLCSNASNVGIVYLYTLYYISIAQCREQKAISKATTRGFFRPLPHYVIWRSTRSFIPDPYIPSYTPSEQHGDSQPRW